MRSLPLLAPLGAAVFTLSWLVLGFISPGYHLFDLVIAPYSPVSQPISGLGLGVTGPFMNTAFVLGGLLMTAGTIAAARVWPIAGAARGWVTVLVALSGVGLIVDGLFTLESVLAHTAGFVLATVAPAVGFVVAAVSVRKVWPRTAAALVVAAVAALVLFAVFMITFDPYSAGDNVGSAGLVQRVLALVAVAGVSLLAVRATRPTRSEATAADRRAVRTR